MYGAVTWGQFFVYQGFNEHCGWMHTSSYADVADLYSVVVGSALVEVVRASLDQNGKATDKTVAAVETLVASLAEGVRRVTK